jgi:uncharacterized membrane protein YdbT with pleckstrin-like domain
MNPLPHPITIFSFSTLFWTMVLFALGVAVPFFFLLTPIPFLRRWLMWRSQSFSITPTQIEAEHGIFWKEKDTFPLRSISSVSMRQSLLGRLFDYGDVTVQMNGATGYWFHCIRDPRSVQSYLDVP